MLKNRPEYRRAFLRMVIIDQAFDKYLIEKQRIEIAKASSDLKTLFADIHFFLVAATNLRSGLVSLKNTLQNDSELQSIFKKYINKLEHLNKFRNHLEHITDGRLEGVDWNNKPLKQPGMLGNLINDDYNFGGDTFNISDSFSLLDSLYKELRQWNKTSQIYPLWR